ncbi:MAG: helix-hairpin-helix domain-containing protein [Nitrospira sp.]|nr:helix-hairpin-helix domain-containing protein [Nitrospira sp.]
MTQLIRFSVYSFLLFTLAVAPSVGATPPALIQPSLDTATPENPQQTDPIDINSASLKALRSLPGIGTATARKIVEGRPYTSVDDLKVRKILPVKTYAKLRHRLSIKGGMEVTSNHHVDRQESGPDKQ